MNFKILLLSFFIISCGARKVEKFKKENNIVNDVDVDYNIKSKSKTTTDELNNTITYEEIVEPVNCEEESVYFDRKGVRQVLKNTKKRTVTTVRNDNKKIIKDKDEDNISKEIKTFSDKTKILKKDIERKAVSVWLWLWILVIVLVLYYLYKKYKDFRVIG